MHYVFMGLFVALAVIADQVSKLLVVANIPLYSHVEAIPGLFHLTYTQNTGAAWSSFEGMIWLFALIFAGFTVAILWELKNQKMGFTRLEQWCVAAIWAGGLGNMIDRLRLGYVVDMIAVDFIRFPVFNVADCFITCGCIALMAHLVFFHKDFWREDGK